MTQPIHKIKRTVALFLAMIALAAGALVGSTALQTADIEVPVIAPAVAEASAHYGWHSGRKGTCYMNVQPTSVYAGCTSAGSPTSGSLSEKQVLFYCYHSSISYIRTQRYVYRFGSTVYATCPTGYVVKGQVSFYFNTPAGNFGDMHTTV